LAAAREDCGLAQIDRQLSCAAAVDPAKAYKRAKALRGAVQDLMSDFPGLEQLRACDEELNDLITSGVDTFKSDASQKTLQPKPEVRKSTQAPVVPATEPTTENKGTDDIEPALGVSDLLDEALRDIEAA
jgi:hypothetical protein